MPTQKPIIQSKTIIKFKKYPLGEDQSTHFKLPLGSEYLSLHFNKQGHIQEMEVIYKSKVTTEMQTDYEWFSLAQEQKEEV